MDAHFVTDNMDEIVSLISMQITENQLCKHDFFCGRFFFWVGSK